MKSGDLVVCESPIRNSVYVFNTMSYTHNRIFLNVFSNMHERIPNWPLSPATDKDIVKAMSEELRYHLIARFKEEV